MATRTSALSSQKAPDDSLPAISNRASRAVQGLLWWHILNAGRNLIGPQVLRAYL